MSDFRSKLYDRYVSTFKSDQLDNRQTESTYEYYDAKFLPLLKQFGPDSRIVELGCGPGYMMSFLRERGFSNVSGIDISEEQIVLAQKKGLDAEVQDVFDYLENVKSDIDVIFAIDFVEHFAKDELLILLQKIRHSLKEGGILILQTPNGQGVFPHQIIYSDLTHMTILTPVSLQQLLRFTGFENILFFETGPDRSITRHWPRVVLWEIIKFIANAVRMVEAGKRQQIWTENMICICSKSENYQK